MISTLKTYRADKYHPRVVKAFAKLLSKSEVVAPVEVLIEMGNLSKENHDAWRKGQVPCLERVIDICHFKRLNGSWARANKSIDANAKQQPRLFIHWQRGWY